MPDARLIDATCPARAALAGNPSDGYGGAVVSIPVRTRCAVVTLRPDAQYRFSGVDNEITLATWNDVVRLAGEATPESPHALALATTAAVGPTPGFALDVTSTIARSVGLAGSSAIVIAALRALYRHAVRDLPHPDVVASTALAVEVAGLGIAAGLQDRVVQAYGHPMLMRFDAASMGKMDGRPVGTYRKLDVSLPLRFFVATLAVESEPSQVVHSSLRTRHAAGDNHVEASMTKLARLAEQAADAFECGDVTLLGAAMDATFDLRRTLVDVSPQLELMVQTARSAGASANSTGSGGSIVVLVRDEPMELVARRLLAQLGCELIDVGNADQSSTDV